MPKFKKMYALVVDTETDGHDHVIDIGATLCDLHGNIYERFSFLIYDLYKRFGPYYEARRPTYAKMLDEKKIEPVRFSKARNKLIECQEKTGADVWAYNGPYDERVTGKTTRYFKIGESFFAPGVQWHCLWKGIACLQNGGYLHNFPDHKTITASGKFYSSSAESVFRHAFADGFEEVHTASDDSKIEAAILRWESSRPNMSYTKLRELVRGFNGAPYRAFAVPQELITAGDETNTADESRNALVNAIAATIHPHTGEEVTAA
jgi:hypothetical protein